MSTIDPDARLYRKGNTDSDLSYCHGQVLVDPEIGDVRWWLSRSRPVIGGRAWQASHEMAVEDRHAYRQAHTLPVLDKLKTWLAQTLACLPTTPNRDIDTLLPLRSE